MQIPHLLSFLNGQRPLSLERENLEHRQSGEVHGLTAQNVVDGYTRLLDTVAAQDDSPARPHPADMDLRPGSTRLEFREGQTAGISGVDLELRNGETVAVPRLEPELSSNSAPKLYLRTDDVPNRFGLGLLEAMDDNGWHLSCQYKTSPGERGDTRRSPVHAEETTATGRPGEIFRREVYWNENGTFTVTQGFCRELGP